jgi:hypothetical protein
LKKIEDAGKSDYTKNEDIGMKKLKYLLDKVTKNDYKEEFVSYE